ncbi:MAG: tetratricopeptide repeat protein [Blastocatellia bacterium]|nr:tetratricopeptide repeat protein [Blastocatellia bacterium]
MRLGDFAKSIEDNSTAIRLDPTNATAYENRAIAYRELGDEARAAADEKRAAAINSKAAPK